MIKRLAVVLLILIALIIPCLPLQAAGSVAPPDGTTAAITEVWANKDLLELGDMMIYFLYNVPYANPPTQDIMTVYYFYLYEPTGTILLARAYIFPYYTNGYNFGCASFYFPAASNPGWGSAFKIHITGNDDYLSAPFDYLMTMNNTNYSIKTNSTQQRDELRSKMLNIARILETKWSAVLTDEADVGTVLSTKGELYFRNDVPFLQYICPDMFYFQISDPVYATPTFSTTYQSGIANQFTGTWVGTSLAASGSFFGTDTQLIGAMVTIVLCIIVTGIAVRKLQSINSGLMDSFTIVIVSASMGIFPFGLMGLVVYFLWAYMGYILIFRR